MDDNKQNSQGVITRLFNAVNPITIFRKIDDALYRAAERIADTIDAYQREKIAARNAEIQAKREAYEQTPEYREWKAEQDAKFARYEANQAEEERKYQKRMDYYNGVISPVELDDMRTKRDEAAILLEDMNKNPQNYTNEEISNAAYEYADNSQKVEHYEQIHALKEKYPNWNALDAAIEKMRMSDEEWERRFPNGAEDGYGLT